MPIYRVRDGVEHVAGKPVPVSRAVDLTEAEALYDLSLDRIKLDKSAGKKAAPVAEVAADGGD